MPFEWEHYVELDSSTLDERLASFMQKDRRGSRDGERLVTIWGQDGAVTNQETRLRDTESLGEAGRARMLGPESKEGCRAEWKPEESEGAHGTGRAGETLVLMVSGLGCVATTRCVLRPQNHPG